MEFILHLWRLLILALLAWINHEQEQANSIQLLKIALSSD